MIKRRENSLIAKVKVHMVHSHNVLIGFSSNFACDVRSVFIDTAAQFHSCHSYTKHCEENQSFIEETEK